MVRNKSRRQQNTRICMNGIKCWKADCVFWHPKGRKIKASTNVSSSNFSASSRRKTGPPPCKFGDACRNISTCMFAHPGVQSQNQPECRFGRNCKRPDCFYLHPGQKQKRETESEKNILMRGGFGPFLHPKARTLTQVSNTFDSADNYWITMMNNHLCDYHHFFTEATKPPLPVFYPASVKTVKMTSVLRIDDSKQSLPSDGVQFHLVQIDATTHIVVDQDEKNPRKITIQPRIQASKAKIRFLGYIGTFVSNVRCAAEMLSDDDPPAILRSILDPTVVQSGDFVESDLPKDSLCNESQRRAVNGLKYMLEVIQGPPGTGKSTTIAEIIKYKIPPKRLVLVTATRNKALDSIAEKFIGTPIVVFGTKNRMGPTAKRSTLESQIRANPKVRQLFEEVRTIKTQLKMAELAIQEGNEQPGSNSSRSQRKSAPVPVSSQHPALKAILEDLREANASLQSERDIVKRLILRNARVLLSTISSTGKMTAELVQTLGASNSQIHTALIDEAGCMEEISMAVILKLRPKNVILVGDHKQLPPLTLLQSTESRLKKYDRSLMERCVDVSQSCHTLTIQYRMHRSIQDLVSKLYYFGKLSSGPIVRNRSPPIIWQICSSEEQSVNVSYRNSAQSLRCVDIYVKERKRFPEESIMIISFYNPQVQLLHEVFKRFNDPKLQIVSVDGSQGSEADCVIISTVRSNNDSSIGFLKDERRINVSISRAKQVLYFVGNPETFKSSKHPSWGLILSNVRFEHERNSEKSI
uniref:Expressed protein n=1 Tax=Hirondellea gigas TaxID=1518452 RepID=A0A6A7G2U3_9CRUS